MTTFPYTVEAGKNADPPVDFARVLRTVESLRAMTVERGCTPGEAETAALKIGQAVQRYGLVIKPPAGPPRIGQRSVAIAGVEALAETKDYETKPPTCIILTGSRAQRGRSGVCN